MDKERIMLRKSYEIEVCGLKSGRGRKSKIEACQGLHSDLLIRHSTQLISYYYDAQISNKVGVDSKLYCISLGRTTLLVDST